MGQGESREKYEAPLRELEGIVLKNVAMVVEEVESKNNEIDKHWIAEKFNFSEIVSTRIFPVFYMSESEDVNVKALLSGLILCLNGNVQEKLNLLYTIFELDDSNGVSKDELQAVLSASCEAAFRILNSLIESALDIADLSDYVSRVVERAFEQAVLVEGKLTIKNFDEWCQSSQVVMETLFGQQCQLSLDEVSIALSMENLAIQADEPSAETTEQINDLPESEKEVRYASDLFKDTVPTGGDTEGHKFFDMLSTQSTTNVSQGISTEALKSEADLHKGKQVSSFPVGQAQVPGSPLDPTHSSLIEQNIPSQDPLHHMYPSQLLSSIQNYSTGYGQSQTSEPQDPSMLQAYQMPFQQTPAAIQDFPVDIAAQQDTIPPNLSVHPQIYQVSPHEPPSVIQPFPQTHSVPLQDTQTQEPIPILQATPAFSQNSTDLDESGFLEMEPPLYDHHPPPYEHHPYHDQPPPMYESHLPFYSQASPTHLAFQQPHEVVQQPPLSPLPEDILDDKQSDAERHHSAWIPSIQTREVLTRIKEGKVKTEEIDQKYLTSPGIVIEGPQGDPVKDLILKHFGEENAPMRKSLTVESVPFDESGLRQLLAAQCWHAALDFTSQFLTAHGQGVGQLGQRALHTHKTLQIWFCRIGLLFKLHMYGTAEAELDPFGNLDKPDLFYEFYPDTYPSRKGCMVPFSLRILHAELPQYTGRADEALDRMYYLQRICQQVLKNLRQGLFEDGSEGDITEKYKQASEKLWMTRELRLMYSIGNCFAVIKDYYSAVSIFQIILKRDESNKSALLSGIGRLYIHLGNVEKGQEYFDQAEALAAGDNKSQSMVVMNRGLTSLGSGHYEAAYKHFVVAAEFDPNNVVAINNEAVCLLFLGKLREALGLLEKMLERDPLHTIQEGVVFNLCTIYELESSQSFHKKQKLLELIAQYKGDGFNIANLRMG